MPKLISLVLPVYNEMSVLNSLYKEIKSALYKSPYDFELIFVNDGSTDGSLTVLTSLAKKDRRITIINLSRNFGHQIAITAGLEYSRGDAVITLDSDLQDPPTLCISLIKKWEAGYEVVYAKRQSRKGDSLFKRTSANLFYRFLNTLSDTEIPYNVGDFRLIDRKVVDELKKFREHHRFLRGLISYIGFKQTFVLFDRSKRHSGQTAYSLTKMWRFAMDAVTGFSVAPIRFVSRIGYLVALFSLIGIIYAAGVRILTPAKAVPGWAFVTIAIFFIGGVQLIILGILGNYIGRTYTEAQNRPLYIVSSIYNKKPKR